MGERLRDIDLERVREVENRRERQRGIQRQGGRRREDTVRVGEEVTVKPCVS